MILVVFNSFTVSKILKASWPLVIRSFFKQYSLVSNGRLRAFVSRCTCLTLIAHLYLSLVCT